MNKIRIPWGRLTSFIADKCIFGVNFSNLTLASSDLLCLPNHSIISAEEDSYNMTIWTKKWNHVTKLQQICQVYLKITSNHRSQRLHETTWKYNFWFRKAYLYLQLVNVYWLSKRRFQKPVCQTSKMECFAKISR